MNPNATWYTLDNQANIYPPISNAKNTNVFRICCYLTQRVNPDILQQALDRVILSYPYYQMIMKRGLFWYYFEPTTQKPQVVPEHKRPCSALFHPADKTLLFEVSYFQKRINLEIFHALSDGRAATAFLKDIVTEYLTIAHRDDLAIPPLVTRHALPISQAEDSFRKHYTKGKKKAPFKPRAFVLTGTTLPMNQVQIISATMPAGQILALAKQLGASLTSYITALMIEAIYEEEMPKRLRRQDIAISIPVDLRGMFPSNSARNFFTVIDIRYNFEDSPTDFASILASVQQQMKEKINSEEFEQNLNYTMGVQNNLFTRIVPLFIKNRILKLAYLKNEKTSSTLITNIGKVTMPKELVPYIAYFECVPNPNPIPCIKLGMCSFEDTLCLSFASYIYETDIQRYVLRHFAAQGIPVTISTNGGDEHEAL